MFANLLYFLTLLDLILEDTNCVVRTETKGVLKGE